MSSGKRYQIKRVLNNNSLVALDEQMAEVILLGKGIGFDKKKGEYIVHDTKIEKVFVLSSEDKREQMVRIFAETDEEIIQAVNEFIQEIEKKIDRKFTENFLVTLIDHLSFAIKRLKQGIQIQNPFLHEVRSLYAHEYRLAEQGIRTLEKRLNMDIPDDEIGFITLHLHSSRTNQELGRMNRYSLLIARLINVIETELDIEVDKTSIDYARLLTHLRFAIERAETKKMLGENHPLSGLLRTEYPVCYNLSWKLVKIMQNELRVEIPESEVSYLTLHIQRIVNHIDPS
ncbi:PRD domain-containing protein [Aneurinibacillus sp. Ricciae_BoGa-3]|uniref:glucose PTS transporter transcription antiterminator GlcT n=1 Tax=Aneurinibacillus sp. Ricciae_BoGa-3 TaxID=3022697 RepID=UPI002341AFF2|nr:PRD domain-containing protein [Aneurinibacillus sp. Ricciae_BoGa-3]WCK55879.1 PRD domain-containing protein [Aneurinibacillus sp. Ricciae_BoGa-3]